MAHIEDGNEAVVLGCGPMQLILQSQIMGDVVVIHCQGHIVFGDEVRTLQREVEKLTHVRKNVVL